MEERPDTAPAPAPARAAPADGDPQLTDSGTFVVQVPKDQIYRIPPPENAALHRRPPSRPATKRRRRRPRLCCALLCVFALALAALIALCIAYLALNPRSPEFSVLRLHARNATHRRSGRPGSGFQISLRATNPNPRLGVRYGEGGRASLVFENTTIGTGPFPGLDQDGGGSDVVGVRVEASSPAPRAVRRSESEKRKMPAAMAVRVEAPVRLTAGGLRTWGMEMRVACQVRVSSLGAGGRVTSQHCRTLVKH